MVAGPLSAVAACSVLLLVPLANAKGGQTATRGRTTLNVPTRFGRCARSRLPLRPAELRRAIVLVPSSSVAATEDKAASTNSVTASLRGREVTLDNAPDSGKPGFLDRDYFRFDESADFWLDFNPGEYEPSDLLSRIQENIKSPQDAIYWAYHLGRLGFFVGNGLLGVLFASSQGSAPPSIASQILESRNEGFLRNIPNDVIHTHMWNLKWIREGKFKMPYDMNPRHQQFDPRYLTSMTWKSMNEMSNILGKRTNSETADTSIWIDNKIYPEYYRNTFHFQTDGWLSRDSADAYEHMTEIIFTGKQDAMQRTTLVPFSNFVETTSESNPKVLEIAAGTGRFATFLKDSFPQIDLTVSELSPFYLEKARKNMQYWERFTKTETTKTRFMQAAAEDLPVPDASQDCVISVYLFHELPPEARRNVIKEVARVLKPGGTFILTDSVQLGDRLALDPTLGNFERLNEPFYPSYIKENFGKILTEDGRPTFYAIAPC